MEILATSHVHSKWSYDGSWSLEALADKFRRGGSRAVLMTEHDRGFTAERLAEYREVCARASCGELLVVPGIEYSDSANRVHVLVWGPVPFLGEGLPTTEMLEKAQAAGGIAVLAHPSRKDVWKTFDPQWSQWLLGIETWNRKYDGWAPSQTAPALLKQTGAVSFVGLDFHTHRQSFPLAMALEIDGTVIEENILNCLRSRSCSPRALGFPMGQSLLDKAMPALRLAENSRRTAASITRPLRNLGRRRTSAKKS